MDLKKLFNNMDFRQIFTAFKLNVDFLLSNVSENYMLFLNEYTSPNGTWHVVRTFAVYNGVFGE